MAWLHPDHPIADHQQRLRKAMWELNEMALNADDPIEKARLSGKAQGVALALDYLRVLIQDNTDGPDDGRTT